MRTKRLSRCADCGLSHNLCVCSSLPALRPATRVIIVAHRIELGKTTNTAKLVASMLGERAQLVQSHEPWTERAAQATTSAVLFPSEDAVPLADIATEIDCLIIPDGTWAQAKRIARRHPACAPVRKVSLKTALRSAYALRRSHLQNGLCTLEAIAEALRTIEGDSCAAPMLQAFSNWVERALLVRAGAHDMRSLKQASSDSSEVQTSQDTAV
jgi:DTW domain-containing protein